MECTTINWQPIVGIAFTFIALPASWVALWAIARVIVHYFPKKVCED